MCILRTPTTRHMVSFIDFYFHFLANFHTLTSPHIFSIFTHFMKPVRDTNSEPVLPLVKTPCSPLSLYVFSCMNSTYLLTSEERRERERREKQRASEEESCRKFMRHLKTCLLVVEADRVLCHLLIF